MEMFSRTHSHKSHQKKWLSQVTIKNVSPIFVVLKSSIYIDFEFKIFDNFSTYFLKKNKIVGKQDGINTSC